MIKKTLNKIHDLIDRITHHLPETIQINPKRRKILMNILFYGSLANAIIFMFLWLTLYYGYDVFGLKELVKKT
tara:strand:+ start:430 stop:648 length:219 start_codon:yes stop_codon:yes gene_type:complete